MHVEFTILAPVTVRIPAAKMKELIEKVEDVICAKSVVPIVGTPVVFVDDLLLQAAQDDIISLPDGWELPCDSNAPINPLLYKRRP